MLSYKDLDFDKLPYLLEILKAGETIENINGWYIITNGDIACYKTEDYTMKSDLHYFTKMVFQNIS